MPAISSEYQAAEWSVLCSALEKPERFYELRREFSRSDFRDDASRAIWGTAMAILDAPDEPQKDAPAVCGANSSNQGGGGKAP